MSEAHVTDALIYSYGAAREELLTESDDALRARLRYICGETDELLVTGEKLEAVATRYGLKRRRVTRPALPPPMRSDYYGVSDSLWSLAK